MILISIILNLLITNNLKKVMVMIFEIDKDDDHVKHNTKSDDHKLLQK